MSRTHICAELDDLPDDEDAWLSKYGKNLLDELYAMERQQDNNLWASGGLYSATNGVLLVAVYTGPGQAAGTVLIGVIGLAVTIAWLMTAWRAHIYEKWWIEKAKKLQGRLGIPEEYSVWEKKGPPGPRSWYVTVGLIAFFGAVWLLLIGNAAGVVGIAFR